MKAKWADRTTTVIIIPQVQLLLTITAPRLVRASAQHFYSTTVNRRPWQERRTLIVPIPDSDDSGVIFVILINKLESVACLIGPLSEAVMGDPVMDALMKPTIHEKLTGAYRRSI